MGPYLGPYVRPTTRSLGCRSVVVGGGVTLRKPLLHLRESCVLMRVRGVSCRWVDLTGSQEVRDRVISFRPRNKATRTRRGGVRKVSARHAETARFVPTSTKQLDRSIAVGTYGKPPNIRVSGKRPPPTRSASTRQGSLVQIQYRPRTETLAAAGVSVFLG